MQAQKKEPTVTGSPTENWPELKVRIRNKFGKLEDQEIENLKGHMDLLTEKVQKAYGYDKMRAENECKAFNASLNVK
jgi:uncharacterized protein YjbJ (UPF0337 family)